MYEFRAELWRWTARDSSWFFVTVPADVSDDIEARTAEHQRGFGSVRVAVTIGSTTWRTSVFPDSQRQAYVLPLKKAVRTAEDLDEGSVAEIHLEVVDA